ncbi:MAG: ClcB-like voltage-gated chloride channel protein [Planctomycetes bacterium]|nr:ClcB-like voltage-gated chloride channel protein [Planctomycetota bacterium]
MRNAVKRVLALRLWLAERFRPGEATVMLAWAALVGVLGGLSGPAFRRAAQGVQWLLTQNGTSLLSAAQSLAWWQRLLVPAIGGLVAGLVLQHGMRLARGNKARDYMEAVTVGDGVIRARPALVRIVSSLFSVASGGSIGREGAMSQLAALLASQVGKLGRLPRARLRLLVACGGAAGIASAYNAPIGGALFVAEVVLGSIAMESFGPLVVSAVISTIVTRATLGDLPLFQIQAFEFVSAFEIATYLGLGLVAGTMAPLFLWLLEQSTRFFHSWRVPLWARLTLGGLIVGAISIQHPYVWGNGYEALLLILKTDWVWSALLMLLGFKLVATLATVGSGAVGGVFTPTLLVGAALGALYGGPVHALFPNVTGGPQAYAVVGMGAFLAATTHAPLTAMVILFDMTLSHDVVLPLMLACVAAYGASKALRKDSIYARVLHQDEGDEPEKRLATMLVRDLVKPDPPCVREKDRFDLITATFARHQHHNLYVVDDGGRFRGVIPLHEIKPYLHDERLASIVIAQDLLIEQFPMVGPDSTLEEALAKFSKHPGERLPVVEPEGGWLVGSITKTDLLLTLAHEVGEKSASPRATPVS